MTRGKTHLSQHLRETKTSFFSPSSGEVPLSQVPQTGTLDKQVPHSQGDQAVITVKLNIRRHEVTMGQMSVTRPETGQYCLIWTSCDRGSRPRMHIPGCDIPHLCGDHYILPSVLPKRPKWQIGWREKDPQREGNK